MVYQEDQIFLVLKREDTSFDKCRCILIDKNSKIYDYCPRDGSLNLVTMISDQKIAALSNSKVEAIYGNEKILAIYESAQKFLGQSNKEFNVEAEIQKIKHKMAGNSYTLGAIAGTFNEKLSHELSTHIGSFLGRKEGGRLAQTKILAAQLANEEQDKKLENIKKTI